MIEWSTIKVLKASFKLKWKENPIHHILVQGRTSIELMTYQIASDCSTTPINFLVHSK